MLFKKKLPLAVVISMSTMLFLHVLMPINLHSNTKSKKDDITHQQKRAINFHEMEACPADGELLEEDTPYWSEKIEEYRKPKYEYSFVGEKPLFDVCCAPDNLTVKTYGFLDPPQFEEKSKNPCWYDGKRLRCIPQFFIIGATMSATTDLFKRLLTHPDVTSTRKEIHWFSRLRALGAGIKWYTNQFNTVAKDIHHVIKEGKFSNIVIGEGSLSYLSDTYFWQHLTGNQGCYEPRITIANHIRFLNPKAKVIVSLRDPVQRMYSNYLYSAAAREKLKDPSTQKLHELVIRAVTAYKECFRRLPVRACAYNRTLSKLHPIDVISGAYAPFVEDWLKVFSKQDIFVLKYEDYSKNMAATVKEIVKFLDLPPFSSEDFKRMETMPKQEQNVYYKITAMQNRTAKVLKELYMPFNFRLSKILQDDRFQWK